MDSKLHLHSIVMNKKKASGQISASQGLKF